MAFSLSRRSENALVDMHPKLVTCVRRAIQITTQDFTVVEGLRTLEKQREYMAKGVSKTLKSYHLVQRDGYGHAVDLYPYYDRSVQCEAPKARFDAISQAMKKAAWELGITITWGGDWQGAWDTPHYQLEPKDGLDND